MQGKSQEEMGLDSVANYLAAIATNTKSLNETFNTGVQSLHKLLSSNLGSIKRRFTSILKYAKRDSDNIANISTKIDSIYANAYSGTGEQYIKIDINAGKLNPEDANKWLTNIIKLGEFDKAKTKNIQDVFDTLNGGFVAIRKNALPAALGLFAFSSSLLMLNFLSFTGILKISLGLATLGAGIGFFLNSIIRSLGNKSAFKTFIILKQLPNLFLGLGKGILMLSIGLLLFSQVKGAAVGLAITIGLISVLFAQFKSKRAVARVNTIDMKIFRFAMSIGILVLALYAVKDVPFKAVLMLVGVIVTLGLALRLFNKKSGLAGIKGGKKRKSLMLDFAIGMGILVLALHAVKEVSFTGLFKLVLFVGILGIAIKSTRGATSLMKFALGFGIMVLAMYAMQVSINVETLFMVVGFISALGLATKLFNKQGAINMLMLSAGVLAIGYSLGVFKNSGFSFTDLLLFTGSVIVISGVLFLLGLPGVNVTIALGAGVLALVGVSLYISALAFGKISKVNIEIKNILTFVGSIFIIAIGLALVTPALLLALPSAVMLIPLGVSLFLSASGFNSLAGMEFNTDNIWDFTKSIGILSLGLAGLLIPITLATPASLLLIPIMLTTLGAAVLMRTINTMDFASGTKKIDKFMDGVGSIVGKINDFGLITLGKTAMKAAMLLPLFMTLSAGAHSMKAINDIDVNTGKFENFTWMVDNVVTNITDTIANNEDKLSAAEDGLDVLTKIFSVGGNIAQTVKNMTGLQYNEYKVVNGKLVLHKTHKLGPEDFKAAGANLGMLINALVQPLTLLGDSSASSFTLGGFTFDNPFKDSAASKGIDFVARIGNAFLPLSESLKTLTETGLLTDDAKVKSFTDNMGKLIQGYATNITKLSTIDMNTASNAMIQIKNFNMLFNDTDTNNLESVSLSFERIINVFSDEPKWKAIRANLSYMSSEFRDITASLNSLNLEKAIQFEKSLKIIAEANQAEISTLVETLTELIGVIKTQQDALESSNVGNDNTNRQIVQQVSQPQTRNNTQPQQTHQQQGPDMGALIDEMKGVLSSIDSKLAGTIKVKSANKNSFI